MVSKFLLAYQSVVGSDHDRALNRTALYPIISGRGTGNAPLMRVAEGQPLLGYQTLRNARKLIDSGSFIRRRKTNVLNDCIFLWQDDTCLRWRLPFCNAFFPCSRMACQGPHCSCSA